MASQAAPLEEKVRSKDRKPSWLVLSNLLVFESLLISGWSQAILVTVAALAAVAYFKDESK